MYVTDALSRKDIEVEDNTHDVIPLNLLQNLNAAHIYNNHEHCDTTYSSTKQ